MDTRTINVLSLCSGDGGLDLGVSLAIPTARTVCYVEIEAACCEVLAERMEENALASAPIWTNLKTFDGKPWRGIVDCVIGGYPCQPFSVAGKRKGAEDPRHLWPHVARIVRETEPAWCFFENVGNHLNLGFYEVAAELQGMGYEVEAGLFSAEEIGAPHITGSHSGKRQDSTRESSSRTRERSGALADTDQQHDDWRGNKWARGWRKLASGCIELADSFGERLSGRSMLEQNSRAQQQTVERVCGDAVGPFPPGPADAERWQSVLEAQPLLAPAISEAEMETQSKLCGLAYGMADRVERLRAGGNGVVPLVAGYALVTLAASLEARLVRERREEELIAA